MRTCDCESCVQAILAQKGATSEGCEHGPEGGCWKCCPQCNYDRHICPGCGEHLAHGVGVCADCVIFYELRSQT